MVVGSGASAFDLLELCFQHVARRVVWVYRRLRWFFPTNKPKHIAGSVRGFARLQASGMTVAQQSAAIGTDMRSRYGKFGIADFVSAHDIDGRYGHSARRVLRSAPSRGGRPLPIGPGRAYN